MNTATPVTAFVALGCNLGDCAAAFQRAVGSLARCEGIRIIAVTSPIVTRPLGGRDQPDFLNAMARIETTCKAEKLLAVCQTIEREAGRQDRPRWASRELDLDIVRFGDRVSTDPNLRLPHPGIAERDFWQRQLAELAAVPLD